MQPLAYKIKQLINKVEELENNQGKITVDTLYDGKPAGTSASIGFTHSATNYRFLVLIAESNKAAMLYPIINMESHCSLGVFWVFNNGFTMTLTNPTEKIKRVLGVK